MVVINKDIIVKYIIAELRTNEQLRTEIKNIVQEVVKNGKGNNRK